MGLKLVLEEQSETILSPDVALSVKAADGSNFEEMFFSISDPNNVQVTDTKTSLLHFLETLNVTYITISISYQWHTNYFTIVFEEKIEKFILKMRIITIYITP